MSSDEHWASTGVQVDVRHLGTEISIATFSEKNKKKNTCTTKDNVKTNLSC